MAFSIDGNTIQEPNNFNIRDFKIEKADRIANGDLKKDVRVKKKEFTLIYSVIRWDALEVFHNVYDGSSEFVAFVYEDLGTDQSATVTISELPRRLRFTDPTPADYLYTEVTIILLEQ